ncbi:MAG: ribonuclease catalytic domain-containing protein, partial [Crocosphaera sp.]
MEQGKLVEFRINGEPRLAVVDRPEGKKDWLVIDSEGHSHKLRPQRVDYEVLGGPYTSSEIPQFLQEIQPYLDPSSLEVAWELLVEDGEGVTAEDMASFLYSEQTPQFCYAAHRLLSEDKIYFKKKGDNYEPRSPGQVEEIKHQLEVEQQRQQEKEIFLEHIQQALDKEKVEWTQSDRTRLELLEKFVLNPEQNHRNAQDLLKELGQGTTPEAAFDLLVALKWWSPNENLFLKRSSYPLNFPQKVLDVASSYLQTLPPDPDSDRLDLTHLKVYTIDDESTEEIDDGLSIEYLEDEQVKLWIHIADPTRLVTPGDELDLDARKRSTTLYLPTGMISMFPMELATGPMSLRQGQLCAALSFGVILDSQGAVLDYSIHASLIKPTYRLTYHDVDEMLQLGITAESELAVLAEAAKKRHQWRQSQGSITIKMPEAIIKVKSEEEIVIELLETSISRQLVAEMMILAGEVAGTYCRENSIPV